MEEVWLPVRGYHWLYEVSNMGRVRSFSKRVRSKASGSYWKRGRILKRNHSGYGYAKVNLCVNGETNRVRVSSLVLEAFVGPRPEGHVVCHGPNGRTDDSIDNLSWGTRSKNCGEDRVRDGTDTRGAKSWNAKLTELDVKAIRHWVNSGYSYGELSKIFDVTSVHIGLVARGISWSWL